MNSMIALRAKIDADRKRREDKQATLDTLSVKIEELERRYQAAILSGEPTEGRDIRKEILPLRKQAEELTEQLEILNGGDTGLDAYVRAVIAEKEAEHGKCEAEYRKVAAEAREGYLKYQNALRRLQQIQEHADGFTREEGTARRLAGERIPTPRPFIPPVPSSFITGEPN